MIMAILTPDKNFNPLPPHGGRLAAVEAQKNAAKYFNPLPPHGGRREIRPCQTRRLAISIHSLRMEGDLIVERKGKNSSLISIHSLRMEGDRAASRFCPTADGISIHSLRMEGDEIEEAEEHE